MTTPIRTLFVTSTVPTRRPVDGECEYFTQLAQAFPTVGVDVAVISLFHPERDRDHVANVFRVATLELGGDERGTIDVYQTQLPHGRISVYLAHTVGHDTVSPRMLADAAWAIAERFSLRSTVVHGFGWQTALLPEVWSERWQGNDPPPVVISLAEPRQTPDNVGVLVAKEADSLCVYSEAVAWDVNHDLAWRESAPQSVIGVSGGTDDSWDAQNSMQIRGHFSIDAVEDRHDNLLALYDAAQPWREGQCSVALVGPLDASAITLFTEQIADCLALPVTFFLSAIEDGPAAHGLAELASTYPDRFRMVDASISLQQVFSGADIVLSLPAPMLLSGTLQKALRYGCVPVAAARGAALDVVVDYDIQTNTGTGILYSPSEPRGWLDGLTQAVSVYQQPARWRALQRNGMRQDFSWNLTATRFREVYGNLIADHP